MGCSGYSNLRSKKLDTSLKLSRWVQNKYARTFKKNIAYVIDNNDQITFEIESWHEVPAIRNSVLIKKLYLGNERKDCMCMGK